MCFPLILILRRIIKNNKFHKISLEKFKKKHYYINHITFNFASKIKINNSGFTESIAKRKNSFLKVTLI